MTRQKMAFVCVPIALLAAAGCQLESAEESDLTTVQQRIIQGQDADPGEYPWMVQMSLRSSDGTMSHACGASLIAPNWVLTAAHCVYPNGNYTDVIPQDDIQLTFGEHDRAVVDGTEQVANKDLPLRVAEVVPHPSYSADTLYGSHNDVALLRLNQDVELNDTVQMVRLSSGNDGPTDATRFSGWGRAIGDNGSYLPDVLQEANLPVHDRAVCDDFFEQFGAGLYRELNDGDLCVGTNGYPATCNYDSGGPLVLTAADGCEEQLGLVNWGLIGCGGYTSFARVSYHLDWIQSVVSNLGGNVTYEAEDMFATTGGTYEDGWNLHSVGYLAFNHDFGGAATTMVVAAAGEDGWGWPNMRITVGNQEVFNQPVTDPNWHDYQVNVPAGFNAAEVRIHFTNDEYRPEFGVDRNLLVDKVTISGRTACLGNTIEIPATFLIDSQEQDRFCGRLYLENDGVSPTTSWTATVDIGSGVIEHGWNPNDLSGTGELEIDSVDWNHVIQPGGSYNSTGFCVLHAPGAFEHPTVTVEANF